MKIHNYGNDYAFQKKQRKETLFKESKDNAEHQIPTEREGALATTDNEIKDQPITDMSDTEKTSKKRKKKKEKDFDPTSSPEER